MKVPEKIIFLLHKMADFGDEFHIAAALGKDFRYISGHLDLWKKPY